MKIAYTISGIFNSGGMENILIHKANYLSDELGYDVTIITTDQKNRASFFELSPNVHHVDLGINYCDYRSSRLWYYHISRLKRKHRKKLEQHLKENKYDIVSSLMDFDFGFLWKIKDGSKKILEFHFAKNSKILGTQNHIKKVLLKSRTAISCRFIKRYDRFIVLTEEDKCQWGNLPNIEVIPNFLLSRKTEAVPKHKNVVLSVGRFDYQKGFDLLIEAWVSVIKQCPDWQLWIVGGGNRESIQKLVERENLGNWIKLFPATNNIEEYYSQASLYVLSSRYEGFGLVLIEAMSFGLPIVSFACPCGPRDIINRQFGSLIDCYDVNAMSNALIDWIKNPKKRAKIAPIAKKEAEKYSQTNIMAKWDNLFRSL